MAIAGRRARQGTLHYMTPWPSYCPDVPAENATRRNSALQPSASRAIEDAYAGENAKHGACLCFCRTIVGMTAFPDPLMGSRNIIIFR